VMLLPLPFRMARFAALECKNTHSLPGSINEKWKSGA
jgi:hypothetical protein